MCWIFQVLMSKLRVNVMDGKYSMIDVLRSVRLIMDCYFTNYAQLEIYQIKKKKKRDSMTLS